MTESERQSHFLSRIDACDTVAKELASEAYEQNDRETFWMMKAVLAENNRTREKAILKFKSINS